MTAVYPQEYPEQDSNCIEKPEVFCGVENRTPRYTPQQLADILKQHLDLLQLAELVTLLQQHLEQPQT